MAMNCASEQEGLCGGGKEKEEETSAFELRRLNI
jgi:hypothetical protein